MANALGSALTTYWQNLTMDRPEYYNLTANEWVVTGRLDLDTGRNFTSWDDFVGPTDHYRDDGFTKKVWAILLCTYSLMEYAVLTEGRLGAIQFIKHLIYHEGSWN